MHPSDKLGSSSVLVSPAIGGPWLASFQPSWKNTVPSFKDRPYLKGIRKDDRGYLLLLLDSMCIHKCMQLHTHVHSPNIHTEVIFVSALDNLHHSKQLLKTASYHCCRTFVSYDLICMAESANHRARNSISLKQDRKCKKGLSTGFRMARFKLPTRLRLTYPWTCNKNATSPMSNRTSMQREAYTYTQRTYMQYTHTFLQGNVL